MAVLEQHRYRNPLDVLLGDERKTCKGCKHELKAFVFTLDVWICTKKDQHHKRRNHGQRCKA